MIASILILFAASFMASSAQAFATDTASLRSDTLTPIPLVTGLVSAVDLDPLREDGIAIAESGRSRVLIVDGKGRQTATVGARGSLQGDFSSLGSLQSLPSGRLLAADPELRRVQLFDSRGLYLSDWSFGPAPYPGLPPSFLPSQAVLDSGERLVVFDDVMMRIAVLPPGGAPADWAHLEDVDSGRARPAGQDPDPISQARARWRMIAADHRRISLFSPEQGVVLEYDFGGAYLGFIACPAGTAAAHLSGRDVVCASRNGIQSARPGAAHPIRFTSELDADPVSIRPWQDGWLVLTPTTLYAVRTSRALQP